MIAEWLHLFYLIFSCKIGKVVKNLLLWQVLQFGGRIIRPNNLKHMGTLILYSLSALLHEQKLYATWPPLLVVCSCVCVLLRVLVCPRACAWVSLCLKTCDTQLSRTSFSLCSRSTIFCGQKQHSTTLIIVQNTQFEKLSLWCKCHHPQWQYDYLWCTLCHILTPVVNSNNNKSSVHLPDRLNTRPLAAILGLPCSPNTVILQTQQ